MTFPLYILRVTVCSEGSPRVRRDQDGTKKGNRINLQFTFTEIFLTIPSHEAYFGPQIIGQEL